MPNAAAAKARSPWTSIPEVSSSAPPKITPSGLGDYFGPHPGRVPGGPSLAGHRGEVGRLPGRPRRLRPEAVAAFLPAEVERLGGDTRIVRNRAKIAATVTNAARLIELDSLDGGFGAWLRSHGDFERTVAALRREFRFLGAAAPTTSSGWSTSPSLPMRTGAGAGATSPRSSADQPFLREMAAATAATAMMPSTRRTSGVRLGPTASTPGNDVT